MELLLISEKKLKISLSAAVSCGIPSVLISGLTVGGE